MRLVVTGALGHIGSRLVRELPGFHPGVEIIMDNDVPMYRIDAFLIDTTLEYALTAVARASGLTYKLTDDKQIRISKKKK